MPVARDHMSRDLLSVSPGDSLSEVAQRMVDRDVGALLVMEGEELSGILTERDVLRAVAAGIEAEHGNGALVGNAVALHAFHRRGLSRAVRADQAEDLSLAHLERDLVDGDGRAVGLPDPGDFDDGRT